MQHSAFATRWRQAADTCDKRAQNQRDTARERYDAASRPLSPMKIGSHVTLQHHDTGLWGRTGIIVAVGRHRTYLVKLPSGRILWRNRHFLRLCRPLVPTNHHTSQQTTTVPPPSKAKTTNPPQRVRFADVFSRRSP